MSSLSPDAIVLRGVVKNFRKKTIRGEYTTFKSELVRWFKNRRNRQPPQMIQALRGVDLDVPRGKTVGILGRNGSGKSTLLKLITGIYTPTSGSIEVRGRISALLDLGAGFHPDFSGRENILINGIILGMSRAEVRERMDEIIAFSELGEFIDEPVRTYSSGMYMRLAFSVATHVDPDILIVDEILAVGDEHFGKKSLAKMMDFRARGKTIVLVTHDLSSVERWCDLAIWLDGGKVRKVGPPAEITAEYRRAVALAEAQDVIFTPQALSPGGGALPSVEGAVTTGTASVSLAPMRLLSQGGEEVSGADTEEPLELELTFTSHGSVKDAVFSVSFRREDGLEVFATSSFAEGLKFPDELPLSGQIRLLIERVGLVPGVYALNVKVTSKDGQIYFEQNAMRTCVVRSARPHSGIVRPLHRWTLLPSQELTPNLPAAKPLQRVISS